MRSSTCNAGGVKIIGKILLVLTALWISKGSRVDLSEIDG